jgi:hypothetical protein
VSVALIKILEQEMVMSREKTQYKKVSSLKPDDYRQVGQWEKVNPLRENLSKLLVKHGDKPVYLHGEKVQARFNKCYEAKKKRVMLPQEPQQVRMVVDQISTNKLIALKGICEFEINSRKAEQI